MSDIVLQKIDKGTLNKAQFMYFGDKDIGDICTVLNLEPETVRYYVFGEDGNGTDKSCWHAIKKKLKPTAMALFLKDKASTLEQTAGVALEIVSTALGRIRDDVRSGELVLSIDDISKMSKVVVDLDKMYRLESGLSTETIEHLGLTRAEAREILQSDPFAQDTFEVTPEHLPWIGDSNE